MSLLYRLEEKHFGRLSYENVIMHASTNAEFCKQWLVHSIRSQCSNLELALAIAFAKSWQIPEIFILQEYLDALVPTNTVNKTTLDERIFEQLQAKVPKINALEVHETLNQLELVNLSKMSEDTLSSYASTHAFKIPDAILKGVISSTKSKLHDVTLFGDQGRSSKDESIRNNSHYPTPLPNNLLELALIERIMCSCAGSTMQFAEPSVVLRYMPGEYYKWHYDHIYPHNSAIEQQITQFGQRVKTAIFYLNDDYDGGNTEFKKPKISVKPEAGKVLVFNNVDKDNDRLIESIHRGVEVSRGEKWIITLWFRDKPFWLRSGLL
jgi:hypothetical protein